MTFVLGGGPYAKIIIGITDEFRRELPLLLGLIYKITTSRFIRIPTGWQLQQLPRYEMPNSILYMGTGSIFISLFRIMAKMHLGIFKPEVTAFFFMVYTQLSIWANTRGVPVNPRVPWMVSILGNLVSCFEEVAYDNSGDSKLFAILWMTFGAFGCIEFVLDFEKSNKFEVALIQRTNPVKYHKLNLKVPNPYWMDASAVPLAVLVAKMEVLPMWAHLAFELSGNIAMFIYITTIMVDKFRPDPLISVEEAKQKQAPTALKPSTGVSPHSEKGNILQQQGLDDGNNAENN